MISVPELHHTGLLADVSDALCVANQGLALEWPPDRSDHVLVKSELHTFALVLFVGDSPPILPAAPEGAVMSINPGPKGRKHQSRRTERLSFEGGISPGLRAQIAEAAQKICADHKAELADVLKARRAARLFESIICPHRKSVGSLTETLSISTQDMGAIAGEFGGFLSDAIRVGTDFLEGQMAILSQAWTATLAGSASKPVGTPFAADPAPRKGGSGVRHSAAPETPRTTADVTPPAAKASAMPPANTDEVMLQKLLRQFMPMLVTTLNQGGDGYRLAETVNTLFGRITYDRVAGLGSDRIMELIKAEPDLWAQVAPIEAKFRRLLDEFTGCDARAEGEVRQGTDRTAPSRGRRGKPPAESE